MKYWSVAVKGDDEIDVDLQGRYLIIRQVAVGDVEGEMPLTVVLNVMPKGETLDPWIRPHISRMLTEKHPEKHPIETLCPRIRPQQQMNWAFDQNLTLSHTMPNGIVYFSGTICKRPYPPHGFKTLSSFAFYSGKNMVVARPRPTGFEKGTSLKGKEVTSESTVDECLKEVTKVPTVNECLEEALRFDKGDPVFHLRAMMAFQDKSIREVFMGLKHAQRMRFLELLFEEEA